MEGSFSTDRMPNFEPRDLWTLDHQNAAQQEGWTIFNADSGIPVLDVIVDEPFGESESDTPIAVDRFTDGCAAYDYVKFKADAGSALHRLAIFIHDYYTPDAWKEEE